VLDKINWEKQALFATLCYPVTIHFCIILEQYFLAGLYVALIVCLVALDKLSVKQTWRAISLFVISLGLVTSIFITPKSVIFLPPIVIPLMLAYLFGKSLTGNRLAYITDIACKINKQALSDRERDYTRLITKIWTVFFVAIAIEAVLVAMFADLKTWSYVTNFLNYVLIGVFFIIEYSLRKLVLSEVDHQGFVTFCKSLISLHRIKR